VRGTPAYRGLGAGEVLKMSLQRMYMHDYLKHNRRDLEIRKTVSLKGLKAKDRASTVNKDLGRHQAQLSSATGTCEFELTQTNVRG
jgi:hypothetical protein